MTAKSLLRILPALALGCLLQSSAPLHAQTTAPAKPLPIINASTIVTDFEESFDVAKQRYSDKKFIMQGYVASATPRKDAKTGKYYVDLMLESAGMMQGDKILIMFSAPEATPENAAKIKRGDLVRVTCDGFSAGLAPPVLSHIEGFHGVFVEPVVADPATAKVHAEVVTWFGKNNTAGPDSPFAKGILSEIDKYFTLGSDFTFTFAADRMRSSKDTVICLQDNKLLVVELTPQQSAAVKLPKSAVLAGSLPASGKVGPAQFQITAAVVPNGVWTPPDQFAGKVTLKKIPAPPVAGAEYGLRVILCAGKMRRSNITWFTDAPKDGTYNFQATPEDAQMAAGRLNDETTMQFVLLEVVQKDDKKFIVVSDPFPVPLIMKKK